MTSGGPDEWGVGAVRVVAVGVAPRVDKVVGRCVGKNHGGFGFEVAFGGRCSTQIGRSNQIGEESLACGVVCIWGKARGWADVCVNRVGIVIGIEAVAGGLEGGDFGFCGGGSSVTANGSRSTESEACEDADDGDDGEEFDEGEGRLLTQRSQRSERGDLISECEMRNSEFEKREG